MGNIGFTFDHVYGNNATPSSRIFEECVAPLVDGMFQGYNATVLAYGQVRSCAFTLATIFLYVKKSKKAYLLKIRNHIS